MYTARLSAVWKEPNVGISAFLFASDVYINALGPAHSRPGRTSASIYLFPITSREEKLYF